MKAGLSLLDELRTLLVGGLSWFADYVKNMDKSAFCVPLVCYSFEAQAVGRQKVLRQTAT